IVCSLAITVPALLYPPSLPIQRGALWLVFELMFMRMLDVCSEARCPLPFRLALALLAFDPRDMKRSAPRLDAPALGRAVMWGGLFLASALIALQLAARGLGAQGATGWLAYAGWPVAWGVGAIAIYALVDGLGAFVGVLFGTLGLTIKPFQRTPILSRTLAEFWGRRWNREVGRWLHRWCFLPLARRGRDGLGLAAAFGFSALFHGVFALAALGWTGALPMFAFFIVQGVLVGIERALGVSRWRPALGRLWTLGMFGLTMPLFVQPALHLIGLGPTAGLPGFHLPGTP
ncbi:MAG: hypothetical protein EXR69_10105, partial [Myxococcales bacterium]|nr:hypothetical protein [Myxococcales bacterium]